MTEGNLLRYFLRGFLLSHGHICCKKQNDNDHNDDDHDVSSTTMEDKTDEALSISALVKIIVNLFQFTVLLHMEQTKQMNTKENNANDKRDTISKILRFLFGMYR